MNKKYLNNLFSLSDSDKYVGSYISREDVKTILNVSDEDLTAVTFTKQNEIDYIDERKLKTAWERCMIPHAPCPYCGNAKVSFDELILAAIIRQTYPDAIVSRQTPWKRKKIDIEVNMDNKRFFIEFHGPGHFKQQYNRPIEDPFVRKKSIEDNFSCDCYIWPYWIQRCSLNLKILLGQDITSYGRGALWSSTGYFSQFVWNNSASVIEKLTAPFRAANDGDFGIFYDGYDTDNYVKKEHPIVEKILKGKESFRLLVPKGVQDCEVQKWLPSRIRQNIDIIN